MNKADPNYDDTGARKHLALYLSDPEKGHIIHPWNDDRSVTTLLLTTVGRRSGELRTTPLIYKAVDEGYVVIGSLAGAPNSPSWALNLEATPDCTIQVGTLRTAAHATIASGAERERLWNAAVEQFPNYLAYQERTEREIPVILLTPAGTGSGD